jgi:transketolase
MAVAEQHLAAEFNTPELPLIDHYTYAIVTDGDLMEGVASEAASFAGHQSLGKLIYLYDDNHISIDGPTELAFTEDRGKRFEAYQWHVQRVEDGNDIEAIDAAIQAAKKDPRPSIIMVRTTIGYGLPTRAGTAKAHGEPAGEAEVDGAKRAMNWPAEPNFFVPDDVLAFFRQAVDRGQAQEAQWNEQLQQYEQHHPERAAELKRRLAGNLPSNWDQDLPVFPADTKGMATRAASGKVLNSLAKQIPELIGGSADLAPSNNTWISDSPAFAPASREGRNFHFGVREHAMGAITNGMAVHGGVIPYAGTFLIFSDYMRPAVRLSALSHYPSIWLYTHDSIGLGEDGPTHQPVEQLAALRAIPELVVIRPADANETREMWKVAIERRGGPTLFALTRQAVPTLDRQKMADASGLWRGAYVLADLGEGEPDVILMASGSEVALIVDAGTRLASEGVRVRLVSFPSWELFESQPSDYQNEVLSEQVPLRIAIEAGVRQGWDRWIGSKGKMLGIERFGASAPYKTIFEHYGLTADHVVEQAHELLQAARQQEG